MKRTEILNSITKELNSVPDEIDLCDIGNCIGIAIQKHINKTGEPISEFLNGFRHGVSLEDGSH